jgi:predicted metalloprotease with PDZ domain
MRFYLTLFLILTSLSVTTAQQIHHILSMPNPETHYFHVQLELSDFEEEEIILTLPVWAPGSYLVREFSKNINVVRAKDEKGRSLTIEKVRKNKWKVARNKAKKIVVNYEYYAFELTVRTSFLDQTHGYLNGTNLFMYPEGHKDRGGKLTVIPHASFKKVATSLKSLKDEEANDGRFAFSFADYDELGDCPIEIGNHEEFSFEAAGIIHRVAMYGEGNYDIAQLKTDMARVVESSMKVFGENPNDDYLFIIHNSDLGSGGLEHMNSTTLNVNRWTYEGSAYLRFISLVAHEYFHLWHVKRFRPFELGPFDYDRENYTDLLWVMEGFTSYYDELLLRRAGFYSTNEYLAKLRGTLNFVEGTPGNKVQPVAHSSYDAWIKAYRPNENSRNTTISYYSKGHLLAAVFDAMIIKKHKGKKCMDDFLSAMYKKYYKKEGRGIKTEEFKEELERFIGADLTQFFNDHIYGTATIDYAKYLGEIGVKVTIEEGETLGFGINTSESNGKLIIRSVVAGSAAEQAGLSPNDEILSYQGFRVGKKEFEQFMEETGFGQEFNLIIVRDGLLKAVQTKMGALPAIRYHFDLDDDDKLANYWLRIDKQ